MATTLLFLSGSTRKASLNTRLAKQAAHFAGELGAEPVIIDLADYELPIYNGDLEAEHSLPDNARRLKQEFVAADGFFIASPEYNSSFSPLLKNSLDWVSRPHEPDEGSLIAYRGKVAGLGAASPGGFGGLRGLVPLRMMLGNIGVIVVPEQTAVAQAGSKFDEAGKLTDSTAINGVKATVAAMIRTAQRR